MKILLVRPRPHSETIGLQHVMICEPLELEYLVSNIPEEIKDQIDIKILDMIIETEKYEILVKKENPDLILFTGYITHAGVIKELSKASKELLPSVKTGTGGVHAEVVPEDFKSEHIDFVYDRNGIDGFNLTVKMLLDGRNTEEIRRALDKPAPKKTIFDYNYPDRESVSKYRKYYYYMFHNPCALIKTSFGCPYSCSFCFCREITDGKYFSRDMDDVIKELEAIPEEEIYIVDDDFLFDRKRLNNFADLLIKKNIKKKFLVYGRADFITENADIMAKLKNVGLNAVIVGIESVRSKDLKSYNKKTTAEINENCIKILKSLDIELYATLIIPLDFTVSDFEELTKWLRRLDVRFVNLQPLTPLPGTDIFNLYTNELLYERDKFELWDMAHVLLKPEFMSIRRFYYELLKAYYKVIMRPKHLVYLVKRYGLKANIKMLCGSSLVSRQYIRKILRGI